MAAQTTHLSKRPTRPTKPQRSQTRSKVNVVSKASLALLNPAHAMGIDASWQHEEDDDHYGSGASSSSLSWRSNSDADLASDATRSTSFEWTASPQSLHQGLPSSQPHYLHSTSSPTPELAAFTTSFEQDAESWSSGFGVTATSADMQRTGSGVSSVFEDDEVAELRDDAYTASRPSATRRVAHSPITSSHSGSNGSGSSKALSRLFTWKRSNNGGGKFGKGGPAAGSISKPLFDMPSSAPAHVTTFEQAGYALPPMAPLGAILPSNSMPNTPQDAFVTSPLPSVARHVAATSPKGLRSLSRKSSMPTLREVRKGSSANPLTIYSSQQSSNTGSPRKSTHSHQHDTEIHSLYNGPPSMSHSSSSIASSASSTGTLTAPGTRNRISSVGKGVRKSSFDNVLPSSPMPIVLTPDPQEIAMQRHKAPRRKTKRFEPGAEAPNVPPLPVLASLTLSPGQAPLSNAARATRRRSKSVDAVMQPYKSNVSPLPSLVTPDGLFDTSIEEESEQAASRFAQGGVDDCLSAAQQAQRVNLASRAVVVGVSSPKLVSFSPRMGQMSTSSPRSPLSPAQSSQKSPRRRSTRNSGRGLGEATASARLAAPVVVNVMPPTPDLGADEHATFDGEVPSPGVRRSLELSDALHFAGKAAREEQAEGKSALEAIANSHATRSATASSPDMAVAADSPSLLDKDTGAVTTTAEAARRRIHSMMSEASDASSPSMHSEMSDARASMAAYEPFSFARSLSMMSLSSNGSVASDEDGEGSGSDSGGEELGSVQQAQIVSVSASNSTTGGSYKAQIVSPRAASLASPRCPRSAVSAFSPPSAALLQSPEATRSRFDARSSPSSQTSSSASSSVSPGRKRDSARFGSMPSLSSGQSLASVLTTSTSILDFGSDIAHLALSSDLRSKFDDIGNSLRAPAEIQSMLDSVSITAADEDDCETPRLSCGFSAPMASSMLPTKPLNVRKAMAAAAAAKSAAAATSSPVQTTATTLQHISPPPSNATMTPGLSPSLTRPYPRAQNSSSPHLELDLSLPLDLHGIGLGFEVDEDKPRRRGKAGGAHGAASTRPRLPTKSRARQSVLVEAAAAAAQEKQHLDHPVAYHPKTPPTGQRLLASAMERDAAMGLGLDLGLEGFSNESEAVRESSDQAAKDERSATQRRSSDVNDEILCLSDEERRLLFRGLQTAANSSSSSSSTGWMSKRSMLRSSKAMRTASAGDTSSLAYLSHGADRPGTGDSDATVRPMDGGGDVGFAL